MNPQDAILFAWITLVFLTVMGLAGFAGGAAVLFESRRIWFKLDGHVRAMVWFHFSLFVGATMGSAWYVSIWLGMAYRLIWQLQFLMIISSILALPSALTLNGELKKAAQKPEQS